MLRWLDDDHTLELGVRDLAGRQAELGGLAMSSRARARAGTATHERLRVEAEHATEVPWRHVEEVNGWRCVLNARLDGLVEDFDGHTLIDEVKTVGLGADALARAEVPAAWMKQLQLYLYMALSARMNAPMGQLRLVSLLDGSQRVVSALPDPNTGVWLRGWLAARIRAREQWLGWRADRRGMPVPFPFASQRGGQAEILAATVEAMSRGRVLAVQAPTGLGKTAPALVGALQVAFTRDLGLFWATARGTQRWILLDTVRRLASSGLPLRAIVVPARAEACAACARGDCVGTAELAVLDTLVGLRCPTPEQVADDAARQGCCAWALAVEYAAHLADVVVGDLNYAFDPDVHLRPLFGSGAARKFAVLIDEAHQLPDRARGWASARFDVALCDAVDRRYPGDAGEPYRLLAEEVRSWVLAEAESGEPRPWPIDEPRIDDALERFDALAYDHARLREADPLPSGVEDPWRTLGQSLFRYRTYAEHEGEEVLSLTDGASLQLICRDASFLLRDRMAAAQAVIATSATLRPTWFWRARVGVPEDRFDAIELASPFPPENRLVVIGRAVSTAYKDRLKERDKLLDTLERCVAAVPGNVAIFFGSFDTMNDLLSSLDLPGRVRVVQRPGMSAAAREAAAEELGQPDRVLCAVLGGVFGESVDLPAGALCAAILVGPALPPPELETQLLTDWYDRRFDDGFGLASVQPGMTRVVQAAGRVVRSPEERGAVVLICRRFLQHEYQDYLPEEWQPVPSSKPWEELAAFFER